MSSTTAAAEPSSVAVPISGASKATSSLSLPHASGPIMKSQESLSSHLSNGNSSDVDKNMVKSTTTTSIDQEQTQQQLQQDMDWEFWGKLLNDFDVTIRKSNKALIKKIQSGIPKAVRGTIWNYFSKFHPNSFLKYILHPDPDSNVSIGSNSNNGPGGGSGPGDNGQHGATSSERFMPPEAVRTGSLEDAYVELLKLSSPYEKMIMRDLSRTFPKHEFFKNPDGPGQENLFNVMKAYSLYDAEVGYCQGLSFIVGALLLNVRHHFFFRFYTHQLINMNRCQMNKRLPVYLT